MVRPTQISVENDFRAGFITEATGLNFPNNSLSETYDCELHRDGSIKRRLGFDFEEGFQTKTIDRTNNCVNTYLWRNVAGDGNVTVLVVQVGLTIYFYKADLNAAYSPGAISSTVTLTGVSGAPAGIGSIEAQFCDGNGYLFVTHPYCEPMRVSYNTSTDVATATNIILKIRDFEGDVNDPFSVSQRPTETVASNTNSHFYNLLNQGWTVANLTAWDTAQTTLPSNSDVMWRFKDATGAYTFTNVDLFAGGNTQAPKGHFILTLSNQDRTTASGVPSSTTSTGAARPSTGAFFAGRVFYSGINANGFNSKIYFTQIIERLEQYGFCYQQNDPTSEELFDLLPDDGGVISIPEAGTIYKLFSVPGGLVVFGANGVWFVAGSTGVGFTATDYTVQQLSAIKTISATSFVSVQGLPCWWNTEGIYILAAQDTQSLPSVQSLTNQKIKTFYDDIPLSSKRFVRGFFHHVDQHIRWLYKSADTIQTTNIYEYDRVLNYNLLTGAFYVWRITDSPVKVNAILVSDEISSSVETDIVIDGSGNTVIDGSSNTVVAFIQSGIEESPFDKYLVSYPDSGSYKFTFADKTNADYMDWAKFDSTGVSFESTFTTGPKLMGQGIRKFQNNWIRIYSRLRNPEQAYSFKGIWNYGMNGNTSMWSPRTVDISHTDSNQLTTPTDDFTYVSKRLKVRGSGVALQFKVTSVSGKPFELIGWSTIESSNANA